jgi:hypothetical protein
VTCAYIFVPDATAEGDLMGDPYYLDLKLMK